MSIERQIEKWRSQLVDGWINSNLPWFSATDLANFFGHSKQYYSKLIKQGKIKAHKTSAGHIVTTEQLIEYYDDNNIL